MAAPPVAFRREIAMIPNLKIYDGRKIVKEYSVNALDLSFGVVEDVINILDFENMQDAKPKDYYMLILFKAKEQIRPLLMEIFDGLTEDEVRHTRTKNLIEVFRGLFAHISEELGIISGTATADEKN